MNENSKLNQRVIDLNESTLRLQQQLDTLNEEYNRIRNELDSNIELNKNSKSIISYVENERDIRMRTTQQFDSHFFSLVAR